jgi:class 3 adenylate cyclase
MSPLRTAVLMKTDIAGSTLRFHALLAEDHQTLLREHRAFVARCAAEQNGQIFGAAGDGFWLEFPSVTAAAHSAVAMQEALRLGQPVRGDDRLAMRVVIGLGDVGDLDGEMVGELLALIVRIEAITPADEIYLTAAARLALIPAEIQSSRVDTFSLKGFTEAVEVYRVERRNRSCVVPDACILLSDLRGFGLLTEVEPIAVIERLLIMLEEIVASVAHEFAGVVRYSLGDTYCVTFNTANEVLAAAERLSEDWHAANSHGGVNCAINLVVHRGNICAFRSYLYGKGISVAASVQRYSVASLGSNEGGIFVTGAILKDLAGTPWQDRLVPVTSDLPDADVYRLLVAEPVIPPPAYQPVAP